MLRFKAARDHKIGFRRVERPSVQFALQQDDIHAQQLYALWQWDMSTHNVEQQQHRNQRLLVCL